MNMRLSDVIVKRVVFGGELDDRNRERLEKLMIVGRSVRYVRIPDRVDVAEAMNRMERKLETADRRDYKRLATVLAERSRKRARTDGGPSAGASGIPISNDSKSSSSTSITSVTSSSASATTVQASVREMHNKPPHSDPNVMPSVQTSGGVPSGTVSAVGQWLSSDFDVEF